MAKERWLLTMEPAGRRMERVGPLSLALAFLLLLLPAAFAQPTLRNLAGTVTDRHHEPLRGAVVQVHNEVTNSVISFITDRSGRYNFKRLSGDTDYRIWAIYRGQQSRAKELSQFDTKPDKVLDFVVSPE